MGCLANMASGSGGVGRLIILMIDLNVMIAGYLFVIRMPLSGDHPRLFKASKSR